MICGRYEHNVSTFCINPIKWVSPDTEGDQANLHTTERYDMTLSDTPRYFMKIFYYKYLDY